MTRSLSKVSFGNLSPHRQCRNIDGALNFLIASGYGGQTLEMLALPGEGNAFERVTGFPIRSYVSASVPYHFRGSGTR